MELGFGAAAGEIDQDGRNEHLGDGDGVTGNGPRGKEPGEENGGQDNAGSGEQGGPDLREMERRHKCDPMNLFYSRETAAGTAFTRKESEYFLSVPKTIGAGEQQEIIRRIRSRVAKRELVAGNRTRSSFWDKN